MSKIGTIAKKELASYFSSSVAYIFLGLFLCISLFAFFWVDAFFARNIVDVRPLFEWMPLLMIFLVASLTMRMWSEERRMGTIEFLMTMPVSTTALVLGKFVACMLLVAIGLFLTIGVPLTVTFLGTLDWGPVVGAYVAALLLASAYCSIGLCVSALSESQMVSLLITIVVGMFFYLVGSDVLGSLLGSSAASWLAQFSTGARFESITRGVLDVRDLYYYVSLTAAFLALNVYILERQKWARGKTRTSHRQAAVLLFLFVANVLLGNASISEVRRVRADLTHDSRYTISSATLTVLKTLREPLLIRGYFSDQTHPLLSPLVPQIRDVLEEYETIGGSLVRAEFIDPKNSPDREREAQEKYGIKPLPFQVSERYRQSLVSSYFNVLVQYGDKYEVLDFRDMIEVKSTGINDLHVQLRNLEYDITRAIKKVIQSFQTTDTLLANLDGTVKFTGYISGDGTLPDQLQSVKAALPELLQGYERESNGSFEFAIVDPTADDGKEAENIRSLFGFRPMAATMFDDKEFYFYMMLQFKNEYVQVPLPRDLKLESIRQSIDAALKRFTPGFLKTIGIPSPQTTGGSVGQQKRTFTFLTDMLQQDGRVLPVELSEGVVPETADILVLPAPTDLDRKAVFALDQFLMKGGTIVIATSPIAVTRTPNGLQGTVLKSGLEDWLEHHGVSIKEAVVLDRQNSPFPVPRRRDLGGFMVEEIEMVPYAPFVDVRGEEGINTQAGIAPGISQLTMNWAAPLHMNAGDGKKFTWLLKSSSESWSASIQNLEPNFEDYPAAGFPREGARSPHILGGVLEGSFESYFKNRPSPLLEIDETVDSSSEKSSMIVSSLIEKSPETARIVVFSSNDFLNDHILQLAASAGGAQFLTSLQLVQNTVDWALEDRALLPLRGRAHFSKTLPALDEDQKIFFEMLNYGLVLFGLCCVFLVFRSYSHARKRKHQQLMNV